MSVNSIQVGGDHYKTDYQHWDFVTDIGLHYLLANATKYISRWRKKNGLQDLQKAVHYLDKANERCINGRVETGKFDLVNVFCNQLPVDDARIIIEVCLGNFDEAKQLLNDLIEEIDQTKNINQAND